jgi:glycosyltransferase involved in cell wall biosynthesis
MQPVNVVFMGNLLYPEGLAETKRFQYFIDGVMAAPGNSASVLLLRQSHPGRDDARLAGEHRGVRYRTIGHDLRAGLALPWAALKFLLTGLAELRRSRRRDARNVLFLYNEPNMESFGFVAWARMLGYRVLVDIVEDEYFIPRGAPLASRLKAWTARLATTHLGWFADGVVVISTFLRSKLATLAPDLPIVLIPISVDLARVSVAGGSFHRPARLLYAGNFGEKDDLELLFTAFEQAVVRGADIELLLTGKGMADRMERLRDRIAHSAVAARIRYLGYLPDAEYFRAIGECDIPCVLRTGSEFSDRGFPFKLGEYLATARPVIATRVSDVGAYLEDRVSAMLVAPGDVAQVVAAIEYLVADPQRALTVGSAGRQVAIASFDAGHNGRLLLSLVDRVTGLP